MNDRVDWQYLVEQFNRVILVHSGKRTSLNVIIQALAEDSNGLTDKQAGRVGQFTF